MRKAVAGAVAVLLLFVLAVAAAPRLVDVTALAARLRSILEETTGRSVRFAQPSLTIFPRIGVRVADLEIAGDPSRADGPLVAAPRADFRLALVPLLQGRAVFSEVRFRRPAFVVRRSRDGSTSLSGIASRIAAGAARPTRTAAEAEIGQARVRVRTVAVDDGRLTLHLEDRSGGESRYELGPFTARLSDIGTGALAIRAEAELRGAVDGAVGFRGTLAAEAARPDGRSSYRLALEGRALDQQFRAEGTVSDPLGAAAADLAVSFPRIDMGRLPAVVPGSPRLAAAEPEGVASLEVKLSGEPDEFGFEAEANLTHAAWAVRPDLRKYIDVPMSVVVQGRRFPDQVIVSNAELRFPPLLLIANASQTLSTGAREWKASSRVASLKEFAESRGGLTAWSPSGIVTASGSGKRAAAARPEEWRVSVDLGAVGLTIPGEGIELRGLNGHIEAGPGSLSFLPLSGLVNGQGVSVRGAIALGAAAVGRVDLTMAYLDLDALLAARAAGRARRAGGAERAPWAGRSVSAHARVRIDAGKAGGVDFTELRSGASWDNGVFRIESARARLFGGEATLSGWIDPTGPAPRFRVAVAGRGVRAEELLERKTSLPDLLSGEAAFSAEISGSAGSFPEFASTAAGSGFIRVTDGTISGIDILRSALLLSGREGGGPAAAAPGGGVPGVTPFRELSADFRIVGGKIRTDNLRVASDRMRLSGRAAVGLDKTLDFTGTLALPPAGGAGRPRAAAGAIEIPLVMSGALRSPAVAVDARARGGTAPVSGAPPR